MTFVADFFGKGMLSLKQQIQHNLFPLPCKLIQPFHQPTPPKMTQDILKKFNPKR